MYIADLHIHSKYSRATSRDCVPEQLDLWARKKGIRLLGTGDFTHPAWRGELRDKLQKSERCEGLYTLKPEFLVPGTSQGTEDAPRFVVSGEISSIYKKNGKVRKVHNLILLPGIEEAEKISVRLEEIGNLHSDGRPILGLDSRDLLEIVLDCCPSAIFIPAHIWTPHFSMFGAFSGFDTVEECFGDMAPYIHAVETGLSSDPPMNWRLSQLDRFTLVSNSDAHSPSKLGREANLLDIPLSYPDLSRAIEGGVNAGMKGTIEFYPEEGKYHFDGHRNCKLCLTPAETAKTNGRCPVCGKKITIGVLHRVEELSDREEGYTPPNAPMFESLVPLQEAVAACMGVGPASKKAQKKYDDLLRELGPEFTVLREAALSDIEAVAGPSVAEGVRRVRTGELTVRPGYDGEYGTLEILSQAEIDAMSGQLRFFSAPSAAQKEERGAPVKKPDAAGVKQAVKDAPKTDEKSKTPTLNERQLAAARAEAPAVAVAAGPGTGKTKTLVSRIIYLLEEKKTPPSTITAVTFTNKAAGELKERLAAHFGGRRIGRAVHVGTFHAICLELLHEAGEEAVLIDEYEARETAAAVISELALKITPRRFLQMVSKIKNGAQRIEDSKLSKEAFERYHERLLSDGAMDFDDILIRTLCLSEKNGPNKRFSHLLVDEFQDVSPLQYRLVKAWGQHSKGIFVIGDPDQAVYGFRGADARCFERFSEDFPSTQRISLSINYRSTPQILHCGFTVISQNPGEAEARALTPNRASGGPVRLISAADDFGEGIFIAKEINAMLGGIDMLDTELRETGGWRACSDIAVVYRTHRQAEILEKCLTKEGIPYVVVGRDDWLMEKPVRGILAFCRYLLAPYDAMSLRLCLKTLFSVPEETARAVADCVAKRSEDGVLKTLPKPFDGDESLSGWLSLTETFAPRAEKEKPRKLIESIAKKLELSKEPSVQRLLGASVFHSGLPAFLQNLALGEEGDVRRSGGGRYLSDAVTLTTLHGAKGLEFPVVFFCGAKKGTIPLELHGKTDDLEEERRLCYVGLTRAKDELILSNAGEESPFLKNLPARDTVRECAVEYRRPDTGRQLSLFD